MTPKEMLVSDAPKCGNCRHMRPIVTKRAAPSGLAGFSFRRENGPPIPGKGACAEPHQAEAYPQLFYVTDLGLCSLWEAKE